MKNVAFVFHQLQIEINAHVLLMKQTNLMIIQKLFIVGVIILNFKMNFAVSVGEIHYSMNASNAVNLRKKILKIRNVTAQKILTYTAIVVQMDKNKI